MGDAVVAVEVVAVGDGGANRRRLRIVGDDPEVDRVGRAPHEHVGPLFRRPAIRRLVLREPTEPGRFLPWRLVQRAIDLYGRLDARNRDCRRSPTVDGPAPVDRPVRARRLQQQ
ncbi:MAG: hypothetical protein A3G21_20470 [Acidobacteria bacterium RIFCSPLOWO2_12_FULL_66_21]|nr:MAG: hypothetical protein A3G21_20470 [Acidobacteria bacterium RIFCSPLOWO2_12_FULL_66_21]